MRPVERRDAPNGSRDTTTTWGWPDQPLSGRIWTSRFQAADLIAASGLAAVRVTRYPPRWRLAYPLAGSLLQLAPRRDLLTVHERAAFSASYTTDLDAVGVERIRGLLEAVRQSAGADPLLLCFEDLTKTWCHRQAFAHWWHEQTGEIVAELGPEVMQR